MENYKQAMDYLERLDEAIGKVESILNDKSREHSPGPTACKDVSMREKKFMHRTAVRKLGSRAVRFAIRRSEPENTTKHDKIKDAHGSLEEAEPCIMGTANKDSTNRQDGVNEDILGPHKHEDPALGSICSTPKTTLISTYPSFHHTTISSNHNLRFSKATFGSENMQTQIPSFQARTLQDGCPSKRERKTVQRPRFSSRSLRDVLSHKIKCSELSKFQRLEASILRTVLGASQQRQAVMRSVSSSLCTTEASEAVLKILQIDKDLAEEIGGPGMLEEKDRLDLLMEEIRKRAAETNECQKISNEDEDNEKNDGICHSELKFANDVGHTSSEDLDSESIMEFERAIVKCFISLNKEEIDDAVKRYMIASRKTAGSKEIMTVLNDRVFRNCLGLRVAKSTHCASIKTVIKKLDEYRRFVGSAVGIISRGNLDMDERFIDMITGSIDRLQRSSDPFTCKVAVQSMLSRRYIEDFVELKKLLAKFSSMDI